MGYKDSFRNTEKNAILRGHEQGASIVEISKRLRLTERVVKNVIDYAEKQKAPATDQPKPEDDFDPTNDDFDPVEDEDSSD